MAYSTDLRKRVLDFIETGFRWYRFPLIIRPTYSLTLLETAPRNLIHVLQTFFAYREENISAQYTAGTEFRETVPELGDKLAALIETERQNNPHFQEAFTSFHQQCQASMNPNLSIAAVEDMLIQHLLTERLLRTVFNPITTNPISLDSYG